MTVIYLPVMRSPRWSWEVADEILT